MKWNKFWHGQNISSFFGVCNHTKAPHLCHAQKISQHTKYSNMVNEMDRKGMPETVRQTRQRKNTARFRKEINVLNAWSNSRPAVISISELGTHVAVLDIL